MDYIFGRQDFAGADAQQETFLLTAGTGAYCPFHRLFRHPGGPRPPDGLPAGPHRPL